MTAYTLNGLIFCQACYLANPRQLQRATPKSMDTLSERCANCGNLIWTEGKAPF